MLNKPKCAICKISIENPSYEAVHCVKSTLKMHKTCFMFDIKFKTENKVLLTKDENKIYKLQCPICTKEITEDCIKRNIDFYEFEKYENMRNKREGMQSMICDCIGLDYYSKK